MNDGLRTDIFLRYKPETIACSCIYLAARTIENPVPLPKDPYPWYELYDASDRDVKTISEILMRLYQRVKVNANGLGCHMCFTTWVLGKKFEAGYHTGVFGYGKHEYERIF
jgi:hypothetical protein